MRSVSSLRFRFLTALVLIPAVLFVIVKGGVVFLGMVGLALGVAFYELQKIARRWQFWPVMLVGGLYLVFSVVCFVGLRLMTPDGLYWTVALMLSMWASDTLAYVFGKFLRGPKLCPTLSPNKTWAGFVGASLGFGLAFWHMASISAVAVPFFPNTLAISPDDRLLMLGAGLVLGMIGQAGDLLVSYLKRRAAIKDTGIILAGHGGLLDRIDSLLLVTPFFAATLFAVLSL